jgi:Flp pilus assembly pilin Flp
VAGTRARRAVDERGSSVPEDALIVALLAVPVIAAVLYLQDGAATYYETRAAAISYAVTDVSGPPDWGAVPTSCTLARNATACQP